MTKVLTTAVGLLCLLLAGCSQPQPPAAPDTKPAAAPAPAPAETKTATIPGPKGLKGELKADGSSTVFPITSAVAEALRESSPDLRVSVGDSGTGGGFKKFIAGETDLSDASRPVKAEELKALAEKKIDFIELPVAFDGLAVVVHKDNAFVDKLTIAELKKIWAPDSQVKSWKDVRDSFPAEPLALFGPTTDNGTFEYFTEAVVGKAKSSRSDYTANVDYNLLANGVAGNKGGLGYFGLAYYEQNKDKLKLVPIDNGDGKPVAPSASTVVDGSYKPLSRPLFIYVKLAAVERPEVKAFVEFYLDAVPSLLAKVGYVELPKAAYDAAKARFAAKKTGSVFAGKKTIGLKIEDLLAQEGVTTVPTPAKPADDKAKK